MDVSNGGQLNKLIFLSLTVDDSNSLYPLYFSDEILSQEVADFNDSVVLICDTFEWEMGIDNTHLVLESLFAQQC